ncbi:sialate O-acetylesterase [Pseudopedobacter beijingensis]|uniref:Sialate O-acetylesterase n=1 Tax=Pseudopedobacter beijingensis TaxID=1207056 RepID=A0ABW4IG39_9SPHI
MKKLFILLLILLSGSHLFSQIYLPSFFSDNAVLQRNTEVNIWGWVNKGRQVTVTTSWSDEVVKVNANSHSRFDIKLKTPDAGGPYEMTITSGKFKKVVKNILIGEVWLCSGQSNMRRSTDDRLKEMLDEQPIATNSKIRLLEVSHVASFIPQDDIFASWTECNPETVKGFSAIAYFIAKQLNIELNVPIGVIDASWGGTSAEVWTPAEIINADEELLANANFQKPNPTKPHEPGTLWNTMIKPFSGYNIAGVFWYQGESNVATYNGYGKLFSEMIKSWRNAWNYEFPFYYVQIAPFDYRSKPEEQKGALLREQQTKVLSLPRTGMVVITDLVPNVKDIHPTRKKEVAERLAGLALSEVYRKKGYDYKSPVYKSHQVKDNKIIIEFDYIKGPLNVKGEQITDLLIADESREFVAGDFKIIGNKLIVFNKSIKNPVAVRFGFTDISMPNLFNNKGLPVSPFRTDNW